MEKNPGSNWSFHRVPALKSIHAPRWSLSNCKKLHMVVLPPGTSKPIYNVMLNLTSPGKKQKQRPKGATPSKNIKPDIDIMNDESLIGWDSGIFISFFISWKSYYLMFFHSVWVFLVDFLPIFVDHSKKNQAPPNFKYKSKIEDLKKSEGFSSWLFMALRGKTEQKKLIAHGPVGGARSPKIVLYIYTMITCKGKNLGEWCGIPNLEIIRFILIVRKSCHMGHKNPMKTTIFKQHLNGPNFTATSPFHTHISVCVTESGP